jgi:hypothetical protein
LVREQDPAGSSLRRLAQELAARGVLIIRRGGPGHRRDDTHEFDAGAVLAHAGHFEPEVFKARILTVVDEESRLA